MSCWDGTASAEDVEYWIARVLENPRDPARDLIRWVVDPRAARALRENLSIEAPAVLGDLLTALARCGVASDSQIFELFLESDHEEARMAARAALTDLELPGAADLIAPALAQLAPETREWDQLIGCLVWLKDARTRAVLRSRLTERGLTATIGGRTTVESLALVGSQDDWELAADLAIADLELSASGTDSRGGYSRIHGWAEFESNIGRVDPSCVERARGRLSPGALRLLEPCGHNPAEFQTMSATSTVGPRAIPRQTITGYADFPPPGAATPPAKFRGQPDWRGEPAWPVGSDGRLLMFYGQLPLDAAGSRTAYLFTGGPDEWEALGGGSAVVIQPGNLCHLPTVSVALGPQIYEPTFDTQRFLVRRTIRPAPERFALLEAGADPHDWGDTTTAPSSDWNKLGGVPIWLQGDETPGPGWHYAFQFDADSAGGERGDGAVFYGFVSDGGGGALGWQCH